VSQPEYPKTLREFRQKFSSDQSCLEYLAQSRWPDGFECPNCKSQKAWLNKNRYVYECQQCGRQTSPMAGTVLHRSKISVQEWFWSAYLVATHTPGISAKQLQRQLGISNYESAWYLLQRLRKGMVNENRTPLNGLLEADETIIGGPAKGMKGRGVTQDSNKSLVIGAVEVVQYIDKKGVAKEKAGRLRLELIDHADEKTIRKFLQTNVSAGASIRTDGWRGYSRTALLGYKHKAQVQGSPEVAHQLAPHIHRVFSNLKTWLQGTHHGVEPKYLQGYLNEYVFRFNRRQTPMAAFRTLLGIAVTKKPISLMKIREPESTG
jgi:hypothetical protein